MKDSDKRDLKKDIAQGKVDIVIGTHAIIQKGVSFQQMGLVIIDEQHRFGVMQRSTLRQKGENPHLLVMTATPIPRTLALTLYSDLDISIIDKLPPGRQPIKTKWLNNEQREKAYDFIRKKVAEGRQAFIICPLIEESAKIDTKAAIAEHRHLSKDIFANLRVGLLHGRMQAQEKDIVMQSFRDRKLDILVSTSVVEVGIDIPNATIMIIEGADRFGLSQLHQFRGRVGRGKHHSYCFLLAESPSAGGEERLDIIERTQDGFILAEEDLKLRGPGDFFGTRQSGLPNLHMAKLADTNLLELAQDQAVKILQQDPLLEQSRYHLLSAEVKHLWKNTSEWN
jgi:ATP-dependent DNA helicase RecG